MAVTSLSTSSLRQGQQKYNRAGGDFYANPKFEYLVIGGGGGGGGRFYPGGGGAGGYRCSVSGESSGGLSQPEARAIVQPGQNFVVTIGAGGAGVGTSVTQGNDGSSTTFGLILANGGGGGGGSSGINRDGRTGGSGGGAGGNPTGAAGQPIAGQGFAGGQFTPFSGGGGGGAGAVGVTPFAAPQQFAGPGNGGAGLSSSITGTSVFRGGGGGGGGQASPGGTGGGGTGAANGGNNATPGTANTGGGGGGATDQGTGGVRSSAGGGSGMVVLRYPSFMTLTIGPGLTSTTTTSGLNKITTFTAGSDNVTVN